MNEKLEALEAKREVYHLLSRAYHRPDADFLSGDFSIAARTALQAVNPEFCGEEWEDLVNYLRNRYEPLKLAIEYTRLFRGPVKAEAYPYESMHIDGEVFGASALDVVARYGEAGVSLAADFKDLPDHISAELEFMHYLCGRELEARQRGANGETASIANQRQEFLTNHLGRWVPRFTDLVRQYATTPYYQTIALITRDFIEQEAYDASAGRSAVVS